MIVTMIPYCSSDVDNGENLSFAYQRLVERLFPKDWGCFLDHDASFTTYDWYRQLELATFAHGDGLYTCMTNRCGCEWQRSLDVNPNNHSVAYHRKHGEKLYAKHGISVEDVTTKSKARPYMSGHLILLSKKNWDAIGKIPNGFYGVDNYIHHRAVEIGISVYLLKGVYVYHWKRADGKQSVKPSKKNIVRLLGDDA